MNTKIRRLLVMTAGVITLTGRTCAQVSFLLALTAQAGSYNPFGPPPSESDKLAAREAQAIQSLGDSGVKEIDGALARIQEGIFLASIGQVEKGQKLVTEVEAWVGQNHATLSNIAAYHPVPQMKQKVASLLTGDYRKGLAWNDLFDPERNPATDRALAANGVAPELISIISSSNTSQFSRSLRPVLQGAIVESNLRNKGRTVNGQDQDQVVATTRYDASWMQNATAIIPEMVPEFEDVVATTAPDGTKTLGPEGRPFFDIIRTSVQITRGTESDLDGNMAGSRIIAKSVMDMGRKLARNETEWGKMSSSMRARTLQDVAEAFKEATAGLDASDRADVVKDLTAKISANPNITARQITKAIRFFGSIYTKEIEEYRDPETGKVDTADMAEAFEFAIGELGTRPEGATVLAGVAPKRTPSELLQADQDRAKRTGLRAKLRTKRSGLRTAYRQAVSVGDEVGMNLAKAGLLAHGVLEDAHRSLRKEGVAEAEIENRAKTLAEPELDKLADVAADLEMTVFAGTPDREAAKNRLKAKWLHLGNPASSTK